MAIDIRVLKDWLEDGRYDHTRHQAYTVESLEMMLDGIHHKCSRVKDAWELDAITQQLVKAQVFQSCTSVKFEELRDPARMVTDYRASLLIDGEKFAINASLTDWFSRDVTRWKLTQELAFHIYGLVEDRLTP